MTPTNFKVVMFFITLSVGSLGRLYQRIAIKRIERLLGKSIPSSFSLDAPHIVVLIAAVTGLVMSGSVLFSDLLWHLFSGLSVSIEALTDTFVLFALSATGYTIGHMVVAWFLRRGERG